MKFTIVIQLNIKNNKINKDKNNLKKIYNFSF